MMWVPVKAASVYFGVGERAIQIACNRGSKKYQFQKVEGVGGRGEVYEIWIGENDGSETGAATDAQSSFGIDRSNEDADIELNLQRGHSICNDLNDRCNGSDGQDRINSKTNQVDPREALKLDDDKRISAELRCRLVMEYEKRPQGMTIDAFIAELSIDFEPLNVTSSKINRWLGEYRKAKKEKRNVVVALADTRGRKKGITKLTEEMKEMTVRYLLRRDVHLNIAGIYANLKHAFGEALPSLNTVDRFIKQWKETNALQWAIRVNPSKAKSHFQPAHGSRSEHIKYKNQVWELDGTVADVMTSDAKRWTIVAAIDVFSRRPVVTLEKSNTSYALARNMRKALIKLGIPDIVLTDHGRDYKSNHFESVCLSLGIDHKTTDPFSGDQKPHIERFFGTLTRELFRSIDGFVGHSVEERSAIQSGMHLKDRLESIKRWREKAYDADSFASALLKRKKQEEYGGLPIEVPLTSDELSEWIDRWVNAMYERRDHRKLRMSPMEKWESDPTPAQTVGNLHSLDFLLGKSEYRTILKEGIVITRNGIKGEYHHPSIAGMTGKKVMVIEPDEMGEILVYDENREFLCVAIDPTLQGRSREEAAEITRTYNKLVRGFEKINKKMADMSKELDDPLITHRIIAAEKEYDIPMPEIRTPKTTKEIVAANAAAEAKTKSHCEVKKVKYGSLRELFEDKIPNGGWLEHELVLIEENRELYEAVAARIKKVS
ncbi:MAG: DDE-type integrase/transposase/recombinase [Sulfuricurvum sp.]|uniref:DDE-type integrase/transposase/recombinase n=1 Tax=Sulfuricurvum sp. TaxID=2025608 RepID=UPI003566C714